LTTKSLVERPSRIRSRISNDLFALRGVDGRGASARRYRDVVHAFAGDVGGVDRLTEPQKIMIRTAAMMTLKIEDVQSRIVAGQDIDVEQLTRMGNVLARLLAAIGARKGNGKSDGGNVLQDYLAARAAEQEADAEFEADVEVEAEFDKRPPFESAPASAHVAPDPDFAPAEPIEADAHDAGGAP
jgi:hypothetical protein